MATESESGTWKKVMRILALSIVAAFVLVFGVVAESPPQLSPPVVPCAEEKKEEPDISGVYESQGVDANGAYAGLCVIRRLSEGGYAVQWTYGPSVNTVGFGIRDGNQFTVNWNEQGKPAITFYRINGNRLDGRFVVAPGQRYYTETLTFKMSFPSANKVQ